jgi:Family of unknown function (DUF5335)
MDAGRELAPETWSRYLDEVSVELFNAEVSIEIVGPGGASWPEAERLALQALAYDRRDDVFEVAAARGTAHLPSVVRHVVDHPARIAVDSPNAMAPTTITVDDRKGIRTVVSVSRPADFSG